MSNKEFMKVYHMPFKMEEIKNDDYTNFTLQCNQAFEEMTKSFSKQQDEIIVNYLYEKYKDTKVSVVWVLSKPDFEKFLLEMLPKWKEPKQYLKWEDLEFKEEEQWLKVKMGNNFYRIVWCIDGLGSDVVSLYKYITNDYLVYCACIKDNSQQFFNDLHLERVEECQD